MGCPFSKLSAFNFLKNYKNIPDEVYVPENTILAISHSDLFKPYINELFCNLKTIKKRDWFNKHAYFCLPLTMGNQHGFIYKAAYDFSVLWDGSDLPGGVRIFNENEQPFYQKIYSNFGLGTFTVETPCTFRTPKGINLLILNPPNFFIDGIIHLTACVETDNLRRNFSFNLKVTRPNYLIHIKKGTPIGCILPYPRNFIDDFNLKVDEEILAKEIINNERTAGQLFGLERTQIDIFKNKNRVGKRYLKGEDIFGNKFSEHQTKIK